MIPKLMRHVPQGGQPYCEPFAGAASLFFAREPAPVEVLNDLDDDIVNLFRCLQDKETFNELKHKIQYTLYSRAEFGLALEILHNKNETNKLLRAWAFFVALNQGFGGKKPKNVGNWGRVFVSDNGCARNINCWIMRLSMLENWHKRLLMAQIDNRDAIEVIKYWDNPKAVFYIDPPYHHGTRKSKNVYSAEPEHQYHAQLVETILSCQGAIVLSGYDHPVYEPLKKAGWSVTCYKTACHAAGRTRNSGLQGKGNATAKVPRTEVIWSNPKAVDMINPIQDLININQ